MGLPGDRERYDKDYMVWVGLEINDVGCVMADLLAFFKRFGNRSRPARLTETFSCEDWALAESVRPGMF